MLYTISGILTYLWQIWKHKQLINKVKGVLLPQKIPLMLSKTTNVLKFDKKMSQPDIICETQGTPIALTNDDQLSDHHNNFSNLVTMTYTQYGILVRNDQFEEVGDAAAAPLSIIQPDIADIERHKRLTKAYEIQEHLSNVDNDCIDEDANEMHNNEDIGLKPADCQSLVMHSIDDGK